MYLAGVYEPLSIANLDLIVLAVLIIQGLFIIFQWEDILKREMLETERLETERFAGSIRRIYSPDLIEICRIKRTQWP